jgi:D-lactate dehydrogenase (cytochrome)
LQNGIQLGAIEMLDDVMCKCVNEYSNVGLDESPTIFFKFTGQQDHVESDIKRVQAITSKYTTQKYVWSVSKEERERIWESRKHALWAAKAYGNARLNGSRRKEMMTTDVCVPISQMATWIEQTKADVSRSTLIAPIVGHVGDGNFHVCIMFDPEDPAEVEEANRLNRNMVLRGFEMGGTCTGEHGVGIGKKKYLVIEKGENAVNLMRTLKLALDPYNILNPGKIFDL